MSWSARQYTLFEQERTRPVRDLVAAIPGAATRCVDLGCGPGNSTEVLAARFPDAVIGGMDSSQDMIEAARKRMPQATFALADVTTWDDPGPYDVILANAVLQWVPDHEALMPRLVGRLAEGGSLALQMPDNLDQPSHRLMREVAAEGPWASALAASAAERIRIETVDWYYALLKPLCQRVDLWRTTYVHPLMGGPDAIIEWLKATGLRPFLDPLDVGLRQGFLEAYRAKIAEAYPALGDGSVLLPFPRLFIVATR